MERVNRAKKLDDANRKYFRDFVLSRFAVRELVINFFPRTPNQICASFETIPIIDSAGAYKKMFWCASTALVLVAICRGQLGLEVHFAARDKS